MGKTKHTDNNTTPPTLAAKDHQVKMATSNNSRSNGIGLAQYVCIGICSLVFLAFSASDKSPSVWSTNSLNYSIGFGVAEAMDEYGWGEEVAFGYQKEYWDSRIRINPNITMGTYDSRFATDIRDQHFSMTLLEGNVFFSILKFKALSLFGVSGCVLALTSGLTGNGGMVPSPNQHSEYFSNHYIGGTLGGGFMVNPANHRFAYKIIPVKVQFGNDDFYHLSYFNFSMIVKLK